MGMFLPSIGPSDINRTVAYLSLSLLGISITLPLLYPVHALPIPSFYEEWQAFALGLAGCVPLLTQRFWRELAVPRIALHLSWLLTWIAVQTFFVNHIYAAQALLPALYLAWAILLTAVACWLRQQFSAEKIYLVFAWLLFVSGTVHTFVGLIQYLWLDSLMGGWVSPRLHVSIYGNIAQSNQMAVHMMLAAIALIYLHAQRRIAGLIAIPLLALFAVIMTLTSSRATWVYVSTLLVLSLIAWQKTRDAIHHRILTSSAVLLALLAVAMLVMPSVTDWLNSILGNRLEMLSALDKGPTSINDRLMEWHKAWLLFLQSPLIGHGMEHYAWQSFELNSDPEFAGKTTGQIFAHSHNLFLQVMAELGSIGLILLLLLIAGWFRQFLRNWIAPANLMVAGILMTLFINSNLEYPLWYSNLLGIAAIFMGLSDDRKLRVVFTPRLGQIAAVGVLALAFAILAATYSGFRQLTMANAIILESTPAEAAARLWSISKNPLLTPWAEAVLAAHARPNYEKIDQQLALIERTMRHHPHHLKVKRYILYAALAGQTQEAILAMKQMAAAYPVATAHFACFLRARAGENEKIRPLIAEIDNIFANDWYRQAVPNPPAMCKDAPSLIPAEWINYSAILGR